MMKIGDRHGRLTAIKPLCAGKHPQWLFVCECGVEKPIQSRNVEVGATRSCGCLRSETTSRRTRVHGMSHASRNRHRLYSIWSNIQQRCENPKSTSFKWYGARGVSRCDDWSDFTKFRDWALANGYADGLSIDRKDNDLGYSPENCRWVTMKEQQNNRRNSRLRLVA